MKYSRLFAAIAAICLLLCGCRSGGAGQAPVDSPTTLADLAYDNGGAQDCRVYLEEDGRLVPFLVLTADYNGHCLLLREHVLDETAAYNTAGQAYGSYYAQSRIDEFLEYTYAQRLSEDTRAHLVTTDVSITTKRAIDTFEQETECIKRRVFLLSANEIGASVHYAAVKEGTPLAWFSSDAKRVATFANGEATAWMLRTPALRDGNTVLGVSEDGFVGMGGIHTIAGQSKSGVRPALCMPTDTAVRVSVDEHSGETVWCVAHA